MAFAPSFRTKRDGKANGPGEGGQHGNGGGWGRVREEWLELKVGEGTQHPNDGP